MKSFLFCLPSENLVQNLPESGSALVPDPYPDPDSSKMLDPDPHITNAVPKHWTQGRWSFSADLVR
jgi:hypothetical protein